MSDAGDMIQVYIDNPAPKITGDEATDNLINMMGLAATLPHDETSSSFPWGWLTTLVLVVGGLSYAGWNTSSNAPHPKPDMAKLTLTLETGLASGAITVDLKHGAKTGYSNIVIRDGDRTCTLPIPTSVLKKAAAAVKQNPQAALKATTPEAVVALCKFSPEEVASTASNTAAFALWGNEMMNRTTPWVTRLENNGAAVMNATASSVGAATGPVVAKLSAEFDLVQKAAGDEWKARLKAAEDAVTLDDGNKGQKRS